ncbi:hypothetical protein EHQ68_16230 [Leptospira congkakensis]|uniref:Uncharacterized protein n=1 Tax=Leptospira congkakensis TaxID=2484932 RepID=A0A4Z1ABI9_9LEPT|nr:hypothetical protein [Leptospira congkakensis]TGL86835.1 hypothetical protein EHQ68_16230 [Leptospira congkakensis]TGL93621.1 hypothetical protein EHQ69_03800 [Leptospira congkakensis]TGL94973.1 hypothetical protein EHQ70_16995 [Leptospira congkakensis]
MIRRILIFAIVFPSFLPLWAEKPKYQYFGKAYDLSTGKYIYSDNHKEYYNNGKHIYSDIQYKDAEGKVFGTKHIEFDKNAEVPSFKTEDFRDGYIEGADVKGKSVRLFSKRKKEDPLSERTYIPKTPAVMDGGFDYFVRNNWEPLTKGERLSFHFLTPIQLDDYKFAAEKIRDGEWKGRPALYLRLEIDNFILKQVVKPFLLVYDVRTRRILQFEGLSNINDENGKSLKVKIVYDYPKEVLDP